MASIEDFSNRINRSRLTKIGDPIVPFPSRITRIGDRDPNTGLWEVLHPNGSVTLNGIKMFNSAVPYGTVVSGIPRADGFIALNYVNQRQPEIPIIEAPYKVVTLMAFSRKSSGSDWVTLPSTAVWVKVGSDPPVPIVDYRQSLVARSVMGITNPNSVGVRGTLAVWSYLGAGRALFTFETGDGFGDFGWRDSFYCQGFQESALSDTFYNFAEIRENSDDPDRDLQKLARERHIYNGAFAEYADWLPYFKVEGSSVEPRWDEDTGRLAYGRFGTNYPIYGEQQAFARSVFSRDSNFPGLDRDGESETITNPVSAAVFSCTNPKNIRFFADKEYDLLPAVLANYTTTRTPFIWDVVELLDIFNIPGIGEIKGVNWTKQNSFPVWSRNNENREMTQIGKTETFAFTISDFVTMGMTESQATRAYELLQQGYRVNSITGSSVPFIGSNGFEFGEEDGFRIFFAPKITDLP